MSVRPALGVFFLVAAMTLPASAQGTGARKPIAVVVRVSTGPLFTPDGTPAANKDERLEALADSLDALQSGDIAAVPIALAPSVVACDEAMRFRSGAARHFVRSLRKLAARNVVLATPFANVRLTDLDRAASDREISSGRAALERCTRTTPADVLYPPAFALTSSAVAAAREQGFAAVLSDAVDVGTHASVDLLPARNAPKGDTPNALIARTPEGVASVVVADLGTLDVASYVRALHREQRLDVRPVTALRTESTANPDDIEFRSAGPSPATYRRWLVRADRSLERFTSFTLRDNPAAGVYRDLLARARSSADLRGDFSEGRRRAERLDALIVDAERKVTVGAGTITFTSRRGSVPVTVANHDPYPVRVTVSVSSPKLDFPGGASRTVTIGPPGDTITFGAVARTTGTFPMEATLSAADRSFKLDTAELTVRSTAANLPALAVTIGGAVLLVVFSTRRKKRNGTR